MSLSPKPHTSDLCFITQKTVDEVLTHLKTCNVVCIEGPVKRTGTRAKLLSVYFRDPDGNLIEVANEVR